MDTYKSTQAWKNTLGRENDEHQAAIDKLREIFISFRGKVTHLAGEVARSLPEYTVHDITHIDALWEMVDCICGAQYELNPVEGFVLGGAFLLHDLGMSISAYPQGVAELEDTTLWKDTVLQKCKELGQGAPSSYKHNDLSVEIKEYVLITVLRKEHAKAAEKLATSGWTNRSTNQLEFLIDSVEIRNTLGRVIGQIAHSHWWGIDKIEAEFSRAIGAPIGCPRNWTIDPLKIACILRVCDAAQIDGRRAPSFLRSLRKLNPVSDQHWAFQEKLQKPYLNEDSLFYTSGYPFPAAEAAAWWLCYEALNMIDKELRKTDALLADKQMHRFKAKRVFGIESPERLASLIRTEGWEPIDAFVHIGDLPRLIRALGGEELYGNDLNVPIRELIQNCSDAIRARRLLENRDDSWGQISMKTSNSLTNTWIEVEDNGIGMSLEVIKNYLFEFGSSYWDSELMQEEHPGLTAKNVQHTGKFGIGFFSVFMLGDSVTITTRKCTKAQSETYVVEFKNGLNSRPIIRKATESEYLLDGGTKIRVGFRDAASYEKLFLSNDRERIVTLKEIVTKVAPALDCKLIIHQENSVTEIPENHWLTCSNRDFVNLLYVLTNFQGEKFTDAERDNYYDKVAANITYLKDSEGKILGRAFLGTSLMAHSDRQPFLSGVVTVGGLVEGETQSVVGILLGKTRNAARDRPDVIANKTAFNGWLSEQIELVKKLFNEEEQLGISQIIRMLGGQTGDLPIIRSISKYYSYQEFKDFISDKDEFSLCGDFCLRYRHEHLTTSIYENNLFFAPINGIPALFTSKGHLFDDDNDSQWYYKKTSLGFICDALEEAWQIPIEKLRAKIDSDERKFTDIEITKIEDKSIFERGLNFTKNEFI